MEALLTQVNALDTATAVIRNHLEADAEVTASPAEHMWSAFRTAKGDDELAELLTALIAAKVGVNQFREVQTDLEEAFMAVASKDTQKEASDRLEARSQTG